MGSSESPAKGNLVPVSSLLSPPEAKRYDSFTSPSLSGPSRTPLSSFTSDVAMNPPQKRMADGEGKKSLPISPPISPHASLQKGDSFSSESSVPIKDPQLFDGEYPSSDIPLFPSSDFEHIVDRHLRNNRALVKPTRDEYNLVASCVSVVSKGWNKNPRAWAMRELGFLNHYGAGSKVSKESRYKKIAPAPLNTRRAFKPSSANASPRPARQRATAKRTPQSVILDSFDSPPKAPRAPTNREDTDYNALPDYSPSIDTLPKGNNKVLKTDWKGQMLDLSNDPDLPLLHEAEATLAATLRLSAATYLCSKRRIFQARLDALRIGKEFRKTDAQQACKIDVNKASKLWTAYDKVGWFRREFFEQHL
jgi:hypothetical protein